MGVSFESTDNICSSLGLCQKGILKKTAAFRLGLLFLELLLLLLLQGRYRFVFSERVKSCYLGASISNPALQDGLPFFVPTVSRGNKEIIHDSKATSMVISEK